MVSILDQYHLAPVTKLLLNPRMNNSNMATKLVIQMKLLFRWILLALATIVGMRGKKPKKQKLKNVTKLFLKGFSSSAISCNYSIISSPLGTPPCFGWGSKRSHLTLLALVPSRCKYAPFTFSPLRSHLPFPFVLSLPPISYIQRHSW